MRPQRPKHPASSDLRRHVISSVNLSPADEADKGCKAHVWWPEDEYENDYGAGGDVHVGGDFPYEGEDVGRV